MRIKARLRPPPPSLRHHTPLLSNISRSASLPADKAHVCSNFLASSWRDPPGWTINLRKSCLRAHLSALSAVRLTRGGGEPLLEVLRICCSGSLDGRVFSGALARYSSTFKKLRARPLTPKVFQTTSCPLGSFRGSGLRVPKHITPARLWRGECPPLSNSLLLLTCVADA
jgi:hypothetical protein